MGKEGKCTDGKQQIKTYNVHCEIDFKTFEKKHELIDTKNSR